MSAANAPVVPVWTIATASDVAIPALADAKTLSPTRLAELRTALAAFADSPVVTLEAHALPKSLDRKRGIVLDSISPLARELSRLVERTVTSTPAVANAAAGGEVLYRLTVPAKVAKQFGEGLLRPMASKTASGGVHSALMGSTGIAAQATFVPVRAATAGAATGAAGTAAAGAATTGAIAVAAPLVLMAVAVGASAYADHQRQQAIENITHLLDEMKNERLEDERSELDGCRAAIDKATAILLDQGKVGASLGLDSAVHAISKATEHAERRLEKWEKAVTAFGVDRVDLTAITDVFPGVDSGGGEFRAHLELAALAIALKRRVIVLQGVEAAQSDIDNPFESFVRTLTADQKRVDELEARIAAMLMQLSQLQIRPSKRVVDQLMTRGQVDDILQASYRLRALSERADVLHSASDVVIEIAQEKDGTLRVLPASAA